MKQYIRKWLNIQDPLPPIQPRDPKDPLTLEEINKAVGELLQQYSKTECVQCGKSIIAHFGGFYKNSEGKIFCSHKCIDDNKLK